MTPLELFANAFNLASVALARRNSVHTWWTGIVGVSLYGVLFFGERLYADTVLQGFFFASCVAGWWQWQRGGAGATELPVTTLTMGGRVAVVAGVAAASVSAGWMFATYTDAALPFADSFVLGGSVVAQLLLVRRKLDSWAVWIAVDVVAVVVYAVKELYLTAAVYAVLLVLCVLAVSEWRRLLANAPGAASPVAL
ncbi:MAG TPA: nicotinamide riboside transporter PnuC [Rubricoccaceae bacterium]|jgi:nicotinamide mononucleotide transporter